MRNTWEKLVHHFGTIYRHGISNELINKKRVAIDNTKHDQDASDENILATEGRDKSYERLDKAQQFQSGVYKEQVMQGEPAIAYKAKTSLAILINEIVEAEYKINHILPIVMEGDDKVDHDNKWRTYFERITKLENQRKKTFYMNRG